SSLYFVMYYVGCHIESTVLHLVCQPDENWPDNWQQLLDSELISSHIQILHAMQQIHATHPTNAIPAPAVKGLYHISQKNFGMLLQGFNVRLCSMCTNIPTSFTKLGPDSGGQLSRQMVGE
ncbi:hypothetical protein PAXRUDRAFT_174857, partial [Paxillus rubicundulus Ve08.2h10]